MFPISPLRYPGGKARLAPTIAAIMKSAGFGDDAVFVEPFAGGAGAGVSLLFHRDRAAPGPRCRASSVSSLPLVANVFAQHWLKSLSPSENEPTSRSLEPIFPRRNGKRRRSESNGNARRGFPLNSVSRFSTSTEQAEPESQPPGLSEVGVNPDAGNSTIGSIAKRRRAASWRSRKSGGKSAFIATTRRRSSNVDFLSFDATRRSFTSTRPISGKARAFTGKRSTKPTIAACATRFLGT